jgi:hypothetical protein
MKTEAEIVGSPRANVQTGAQGFIDKSQGDR